MTVQPTDLARKIWELYTKLDKIDQIPAPPEEIAKALFRAANKKIKPTMGKEKRKPN